MRRHFSTKQKAQIVLEILKEERTIAQIASEYSVHPNQLHRWKKQALDHFDELFQKDKKQERAKEAARFILIDHIPKPLDSEIDAWIKERFGSSLIQ